MNYSLLFALCLALHSISLKSMNKTVITDLQRAAFKQLLAGGYKCPQQRPLLLNAIGAQALNLQAFSDEGQNIYDIAAQTCELELFRCAAAADFYVYNAPNKDGLTPREVLDRNILTSALKNDAAMNEKCTKCKAFLASFIGGKL